MRGRGRPAGLRLLPLGQQEKIVWRCWKMHWPELDEVSCYRSGSGMAKPAAYIHDIAHGVVLGLKPKDITTEGVSSALDPLEDRRLLAWDYQEIRTLAVEIHTMRRLGFNPGVRYRVKNALFGLTSDRFANDLKAVVREVEKLLLTKKTARYSDRVVELMLGDELVSREALL